MMGLTCTIQVSGLGGVRFWVHVSDLGRGVLASWLKIEGMIGIGGQICLGEVRAICLHCIASWGRIAN